MVGKWLMYGEGLNTVNCEYREAYMDPMVLQREVYKI